MGHGVDSEITPAAHLDADSAATIAATLQALATPSRLMILTKLRQGPCGVGALAEAVGMEQSAVSHQLRLLRALGLVTGSRQAAASSTASTTTTWPSSWTRPSTTSSTCASARGTSRSGTPWTSRPGGTRGPATPPSTVDADP